METLEDFKPRLVSQRDYMRMLARKYGEGNSVKIMEQYAKAEIKGIVHRKSNTMSVTPYEYAYHLYCDMIKKGWHK